MIRIAICDDDKNDREHLKKLLLEYEALAKEKFLINIFQSDKELMESWYSMDIMFLEMILDGHDGIGIGAELRKNSPYGIIIYVTGTSKNIMPAINCVHAYGYLVKPITKGKLYPIIREATQLVRLNLWTRYESFLSERNTVINIPVTDIYYFEYCDRRIKIVTAEKTYVCIKEKIGEIAGRMRIYGFEMSHQSYVVNLYYVDAIKDHVLTMKNGDVVCLAQKRASKVRGRILELVNMSNK